MRRIENQKPSFTADRRMPPGIGKMPRKVDYGFHYEDDNYDGYEDYDYDYADDYDYEEEESGFVNLNDDFEMATKQVSYYCGKGTLVDVGNSVTNTVKQLQMGIAPVTKAKQEASRTGVWRCPICTYDNEDSMSACDICGVLRNPLVKVNTKGDTAAAPFKFDAPSPDDLVSNGLRSVKLKSKGEDSRGRGTNFLVESKVAANGPESSSASVTRERHNGVEENNSTSGIGNKPETFNTSMNTESLPSKSGKARSTIEGKATSISPYIPEKWMTPNNKEDGLSQLNLAIVGHVDSGKSTLSGRLLHLLGRISQKEMHKYEKEAKQQGKGSFAFAWALDESAEERERGITMTVGVAFFTSRKYHVVLLDSPGHRDFVPNMISGATQADAAILVVDASMGSFEAGIDAIGGQTREHAQLIRSFGVDQIIIVVNKMDVVEYSKERFDVIKQKLGTFLRSCGFKDSSILWIPASAMENQILVANPSEARLSCPCEITAIAGLKDLVLLDAIDSLQLPERDYSKPLLMPICDVIKSQSQGQVTACGKLESGAIRTGSKVLVMPSGITATARSLERDSQVCNIARAGDNVTVNLQGIEGNQVTAGGVICHPDYPVQVTNCLQLKILVLDISTPIVMGSQLEFHIHHAKEAARIVKILSLLDPKTGNATKKSPRCLLAKQNAIVEVVLQGPVCVEEYSSCRALGRAFLRSSGRTIALGIVTQVIKREE
ncbi:UNVERIFIED_CONTAM: HBS1-like protein [Sesamum radiatum]|uniref:HBS1-like protein n=1 Tax=Sesamum radiatum TaxID=300843 RepID=A0AAW2RYQ3_SESRA